MEWQKDRSWQAGLYVHGGNGDENLYLIDGTPLYDTNHALGLFSSFNADVVKNVDFYKSGFPARYGGRLSSVVDVRTADGNMNQFHGAYRIGLLDASVQFEGPIRKGKTSYNNRYAPFLVGFAVPSLDQGFL